MIHAGDTYEAMRRDALYHALRRAQEALSGDDRETALGLLHEAREQITNTIVYWESQR